MSERQRERQKEREREGQGVRRWDSKMPQILKIEIGQGKSLLEKQLPSITK